MTDLLESAPESTRRLFVEYDSLGATWRPFLIGRLLEEGESVDLSWLSRSVSESDLAAWTAGPGQRQLSRRSLAFWSTVLDMDGPDKEPNKEVDPLWPL